MMKPKSLIKSSLLVLGLSVAMFSISAPVSAASAWYKVMVIQVVPRAQNNGDVYVQVQPASGETAFTGTARLVIDGTAPGAGRLTSACMAALLLTKQITINTNTVPSFASPQQLLGAGLTNQ